jgi:hypothetical protein
MDARSTIPRRRDRAPATGRAACVPGSLRERSSPPADDVQHKADDRENNQDVDRGGRNVKEPESHYPGDTKNDGEQKQHGGPLRMCSAPYVFGTLTEVSVSGTRVT